MTETPTKMTFHVSSRRVDAHGSLSHCKNAEIALDTDMAGNPDAFNPAELLLAALSACMIKGIERVVPILKFELRGVQVMNRIGALTCCTTTSKSTARCSTPWRRVPI